MVGIATTTAAVGSWTIPAAATVAVSVIGRLAAGPPVASIGADRRGSRVGRDRLAAQEGPDAEAPSTTGKSGSDPRGLPAHRARGTWRRSTERCRGVDAGDG